MACHPIGRGCQARGAQKDAMLNTVFLHGAMCHPAVLAVVLGRTAQTVLARLPGHHIAWARGAFPELLSDSGGTAEGLALTSVTEPELARIAYFHACFGQVAQEVAISLADQTQTDQTCTALAYFAPDTSVGPTDWGRADDWQERFAQTLVATAQDMMRGMDLMVPKQLLRRQESLLARGAARIRAEADTAPCTIRHKAAPQDLRVADRTTPYAQFFAVEEYDLQFRRFDGGLSPMILRATFVMADAVTVLPYDPQRDRVLLVEQFRAGPLARGDHQPWQLEAIAGRIDPGESPENAARREALEEAGLTLGDLVQVAQYYPSPGAVSEYLYSYVAPMDLPDDTAGVFGLAEEAEDIRGHLIGFDALMALIASGEVANAPLILTALWLERERPRLRGQA